ncbi:MAG: 30S ribosomal protein S16 [Patescibacteria group bacterium]|jgi:small subunit ribosomal protein S16
MVTIRLTRIGKRKQPTYRFVAQEKGRDPWGKHIEILGHFNPRTNPRTFVLKEDRIKYWLGQGATTSDTVRNILIDQKIIQGEKSRIVKISRKKQAAVIAVAAKQKETEAALEAKEQAAKKAKDDAAAAEVAAAETKESPAEEVKEATV